jgi:hypothetical protein
MSQKGTANLAILRAGDAHAPGVLDGDHRSSGRGRK